MSSIFLFTPISYPRERSFKEGCLSKLSNYFYLGGARATVIKNDEVQLEVGKTRWFTVALKVASYVLLFPLTLTLLAIYLCLRHQHKFTILETHAEPNPALHRNNPPESETFTPPQQTSRARLLALDR